MKARLFLPDYPYLLPRLTQQISIEEICNNISYFMTWLGLINFTIVLIATHLRTEWVGSPHLPVSVRPTLSSWSIATLSKLSEHQQNSALATVLPIIQTSCHRGKNTIFGMLKRSHQEIL